MQSIIALVDVTPLAINGHTVILRVRVAVK